MATETERKFLVDRGFAPHMHATETLVIRQSYMPARRGLVVRLRETLRCGHPLETLPDLPMEAPYEHELETKMRRTGMTNEGERMTLPAAMYHSLRQGAGPEVVKLRHLVPHGGRTWEVDVYVCGDPRMPMTAEVEFDDEADSSSIDVPAWAIVEVTGDPAYSNERIARQLEEMS